MRKFHFSFLTTSLSNLKNLVKTKECETDEKKINKKKTKKKWMRSRALDKRQEQLLALKVNAGDDVPMPTG